MVNHTDPMTIDNQRDILTFECGYEVGRGLWLIRYRKKDEVEVTRTLQLRMGLLLSIIFVLSTRTAAFRTSSIELLDQATVNIPEQIKQAREAGHEARMGQVKSVHIVFDGATTGNKQTK
jgi:hypothetical protein